MPLTSLRPFFCALFILIFAFPRSVYAQNSHVVSPAELQAKVVEMVNVREQNQKTLRSFLSSSEVQEMMRSAHIGPRQVESAIPALSDTELAQLAARANHAQVDFAAGRLGKEALLIIAIAVVVVIIIVAAKA